MVIRVYQLSSSEFKHLQNISMPKSVGKACISSELFKNRTNIVLKEPFSLPPQDMNTGCLQTKT